MFFVICFFLAWLCWIIFADKKRWNELFLVSLFATLLGLFTDILMQHYCLWEYPSGHPLLPHLADDFGIYITVSYLFIQWLPKKQTFWAMICYWFIWTVVTIGIELIFRATNHIQYHKWWNTGWSYLADWILFLVFYEFHKIFNLRKLSR